MHKAVLVFDRLSHKLKKEGAHRACYQNVDSMRDELSQLYGIKLFANEMEEKIAVAKVKKLRTNLYLKITSEVYISLFQILYKIKL
jgi:hypothetical protein